MIRGTTPRHIFEFPDIEDMESFTKKLTVTYSQNDEVVLKRTENSVIFNENSIYFSLSQEESLQFDEHEVVSIQVKVMDHDDTVYASRIFKVPALRILDEVVL